MSTAQPFSDVQAHGELRQVLPGIHFVTGSLALGRLMPVRFSRNMTVIAQDGALTLINSVRLDGGGLRALDALGEVKHVVRLAGFHGMDDPFYKDRYGAKVWSVDAPYVKGFGENPKRYFEADAVLDEQTELPIKGSRVVLFKSAHPGEGLLFLDREGGVVISGDCLQHWAHTNEYFNLPARIMMRMMGFIKPHNVGPGWLKAAKPDRSEIRKVFNGLEFENVLPAHGEPVIGNAKTNYLPAVEAL
ncbi:hypothetical protein [Hoeflea prorocentri]|uniref:Uncharacterized protein n=1 Tax=Hoeflea prorocentri TaxID=1922333 RepID=A0A9X3ZFB4_9HYPH|nr:hypothetical protein [Hoeflea prorocentri]MCY6379452.1 hypothetical protein [Hoeflea prorocentri]MDA5397252.1 hypothetical protein [Hoeflea prorocentri]